MPLCSDDDDTLKCRSLADDVGPLQLKEIPVQTSFQMNFTTNVEVRSSADRSKRALVLADVVSSNCLRVTLSSMEMDSQGVDCVMLVAERAPSAQSQSRCDM